MRFHFRSDPIGSATYKQALRSEYAEYQRSNQRRGDIDEKWKETKNIKLEVAREKIGMKECWNNEESQARNIMFSRSTRNNIETGRNLRKELKKVPRSKKREALK